MKIDFQLDKDEDLEYFKTIFFRNVGVEQMVYNFYMDDVMVRIQISGFGKSQLINIGFFSHKKEKNTISIEQFNPITDDRFRRFEAVTDIWGTNSLETWGTFFQRAGDENNAFAIIMNLLLTVHKVIKLKAFL